LLSTRRVSSGLIGGATIRSFLRRRERSCHPPRVLHWSRRCETSKLGWSNWSAHASQHRNSEIMLRVTPRSQIPRLVSSFCLNKDVSSACRREHGYAHSYRELSSLQRLDAEERRNRYKQIRSALCWLRFQRFRWFQRFKTSCKTFSV